ncbi:MAG: hypothetical protein WC607_02715 [Candidatus Micrarchaeia archaeon]
MKPNWHELTAETVGQRHEVLNGKLEMLGLKPLTELSVSEMNNNGFRARQTFTGVAEAMRRSGLKENEFNAKLAEEMMLRTKPNGKRERDVRLHYFFKIVGGSLVIEAEHKNLEH